MISAPRICSCCGSEGATHHDGGRGFRLSKRALKEHREDSDSEASRRAHELLHRVNEESPLVCLNCERFYTPTNTVAELFAEVDAFLGPEQDTAPPTS